MFNPDDYNDNIGYCQFVFEKNSELNLGLNSRQEIQFVANNYLDEVTARRGISDDEVYENDKILMEVLDKLSKKFKKFKPASTKVETTTVENKIAEVQNNTNQLDSYLNDEENDLRR